MSWWNTSNFTDLASKALKNAQQKIDKALDIQENETEKTSSEKANTPKEQKPDFWSTWMGGEGSSTDNKGEDSQSTWSLPWGTSSEKDVGRRAEPIPEKTAVDIKFEVLKAAKERSKAKLKLFPKKKEGDRDEEVATDLKIKKPVPKGSGELNSEEELVLESKEVKPIYSNLAEKVEEDKVEKWEEDNGSYMNIAKTESDSTREAATLKAVELLGQGTLESLHISSSQSDILGSSFQEITECKAEIEDELNLESDEERKRSYILLDNAKLNDDLSEMKDSMKERHKETSEISKSRKEETNSGKGNEISIKGSQHEEPSRYLSEEVDIETIPTSDSDLSHGDISSSVEFVTEKDLSTEDSENVILNTEGECSDQSGIVPEVLYCGRSDDASVGESNEQTDIALSSSELLLKINDSEKKLKDESVDDDNHSFDTEKDSSEMETQNDGILSGHLTRETFMQFVESSDSSGDLEHLSVNSDVESSKNKLDVSMDTCTSEETIVDQTSLQDESDTRSSPSIQNFECATEVKKKVDLVNKQMDLNESNTEEQHQNVQFDLETKTYEKDEFMQKSELSPTNSFVKCMLEDAIDDGRQEDMSDTHSTEKSDGSRSVNSNHESSDEIDTTTSSDIEIISLPTPNGENRQVCPLDPTPLRIALQKTNWHVSPTHRRTDSSGSSNTSKDGGHGELSPGRDRIEYIEYCKTALEPGEGPKHQHELPVLSEEDDNPYHPQRLLKKLAEMAEVVQAREEKLLQLSKDNCDLMETNSVLSNQLMQFKEAHDAELTDLNEVTAEFTQRLTEAEKRVTAAVREKESYKNQVLELQAELTKRAGDTSLKQVLEEKEEQIQGLLQEGEKLSKSQLQSNTIIKKLRQKEKDNDSLITTQKKKLETQTEELNHLHKVLESKEELEKKQIEAIAQLNAAVKKQEQEMVKLKSEHEDAVEKARGLQVALDNSYKEISELHRSHAAQDSRAQELALSAETQVREELKLQIEKLQQQNKWDRENLNMQVEDMQLSMTRQEKEHSRREELLRQEIADLQKQLQQDEARAQELTQGVSLATRPLLRQIENLQSTFNVQSATWEKVEKNLSDRLTESQNQLAVVSEKERMASEQLLDLGAKIAALEAKNSSLRQEKSQISAELQMLRTKVEVTEDAKQHEAAEIELMKQQMEKEMSDLKRQKILLETQLDVEKSKVEQEKKKVMMLQDQIRDMEGDAASSRSGATPVNTGSASPSPRSLSTHDNPLSSRQEQQAFLAIAQEELDHSFVLASPSGTKQSLYEALRQSGAANLLENLQSQLKLREGEISYLQDEIRGLERTRESMAKELVDLSNKSDQLEETKKQLELLNEKYKELDQRYNALLQMYGEKVEESNELRLDLQDIKDMYKSQINQLLAQR